MWDARCNIRSFGKVALLGTGLMGGSLGMALRERRIVEEVWGYDRDPGVLETARDRGAVDHFSTNLKDVVQGADLVVLAVPVTSCLEIAARIRPYLSPGTILTDLGSTKSRLVEQISPVLPHGSIYIGGHPMTGSEESGIEAADPLLWENAIYILTPTPETPHEALSRLRAMVEGIGSQPVFLSPLEHDRLVGLVSHLPHMAAVSLVQVAAGDEREEMVHLLAAGGFKDTTRVAMGNPEIWTDICITNHEVLDRLLAGYIREIESLRGVIRDRNREKLRKILLSARDFRRGVPYRGKGILPEILDIVVLVRDTPGTIGKIATTLGEAGINISEIEILHVREEEGGSIRLGFRQESHRDQALRLLLEEGYRVHRR